MLKAFVLALMLALGISIPTTDSVSDAPTIVTKTAVEQQHVTTHRIATYDIIKGDGWNQEVGHCSGTVVGPHAILTAQHCFMNSNLIRLDAEKEPTVIVFAFIDGHDHIIYMVNRTFKTWAIINERKLIPNESVHLWGSPGRHGDVYRAGYFDKYDSKKELDPELKVKFEAFILPVYKGDSGSGVFDENGSVVAVTSMSDESAGGLDVPLAFTRGQLDAATR
jgi:V8-like Glu-specific endopeptidase